MIEIVREYPAIMNDAIIQNDIDQINHFAIRIDGLLNFIQMNIISNDMNELNHCMNRLANIAIAIMNCTISLIELFYDDYDYEILNDETSDELNRYAKIINCKSEGPEYN